MMQMAGHAWNTNRKVRVPDNVEAVSRITAGSNPDRACRRNGVRPGPSAADAEALAGVLSVLSQALRLKLLFTLAGGDWKVGDLWRQLKVRQSAVSHHLAILLQSDLVSARRDGRFIYYRLGPAATSPSPGVLNVGMRPLCVNIATRHQTAL